MRLGDGFAITFFGRNMTQTTNTDINVAYKCKDTVTATGKERTLDFTRKSSLGMNVLIHAYLPDATPGKYAVIYAEDEKGNRVKVADYAVTEQNRICWNADSLLKFVIVYE